MKSFGVKATLGAILTAGAMLAACSGGGAVGGGGEIKKADIPNGWPLTVDAIKVECTDDMSIFAVANDKVYPLNGQAERLRKAPGDKPVLHLEDIQLDDPEASKFTPGAKMSMDPVRVAAISACQKAGKWIKADS